MNVSTVQEQVHAQMDWMEIHVMPAQRGMNSLSGEEKISMVLCVVRAEASEKLSL